MTDSDAAGSDMEHGDGAMAGSYDVVIAGGGVMGSALAYFLASEGEGRVSVLVVEPDPTLEKAASARSLSSIRVQFSYPQNIRLSQFGMAFLRAVGAHLAVDGEAPDIQLQEAAYLILASAEGRETLLENQAVQKDCGAAVDVLEAEALARRFPWLATEGIAAGALGREGEGWFDGYSLARAFRRKAESLGATFAADRVVGVERSETSVHAVRLASRTRVRCGALVNAAGALGARPLAQLVGVDLPVHPRKRTVFVFDCKERIADLPLLCDPSGVYVRPEGGQYLAGSSPLPGEPDPDCEDLVEDWPRFEEVIWPALAARVPAFEAIKPVGAWAGHYDVNPADHNAILGPHPEVGNFIFCNGFSGHGIQQSPGVGRGLAELILHGGYRSLDLSAYDFSRFAEGRPILEKNVI